MYAASKEYKQAMREKWRNGQSYIRVTLGLVNQQAQASGVVCDTCTYYSNLIKPFNNYLVKELYATCDQDYSSADGTMYFLPRNKEDIVLNEGIVSETLMGEIEVRFPIPYDIKGLTLEFGKSYPVDFSILSDNGFVEVNGNENGRFVTEEIFKSCTFLRFVPHCMVNGVGRFRIHQITMGIGIYFDNRKIISATKKERISPIMEELPTIDFSLGVNNKGRIFDIDNESSSVNFLEIGQKVDVLYGFDIGGVVEWIPGAMLSLKEWSADDELMTFVATDRFDSMEEIYYWGKYRKEGARLYDLAIDVLKVAGIDARTYQIDEYLKEVIVTNPLPAISCKNLLQLIANAGRCVLYQDRLGNIIMKSSFVPDMVTSSDNETYFSNASNLLDKVKRDSYAMGTRDYTDASTNMYFLPRKEEDVRLTMGYISESVADNQGIFQSVPTVTIDLEARYKCFGLTLEFGSNHPTEVLFYAYLNEVLQEEHKIFGLEQITVVDHEFPEFDRLLIKFTKGCPNNRVVLDNIVFGDSTDYVLAYGMELAKTPKGTQLAKVRELQITRTLYSDSQEAEPKELAKETVDLLTPNQLHTFYLSNPSYGYSVVVSGNRIASIVSSSSYLVVVEISGDPGEIEIILLGKEFEITQARISRQLNPTGNLVAWENPLVSSTGHANDLADWIGDYLKADREYDIQYRGEPRIDANDIAFLENQYVPDLLIRVFDHTLNFNGAISGTIKARRDMSYVDATQNKLASK